MPTETAEERANRLTRYLTEAHDHGVFGVTHARLGTLPPKDQRAIDGLRTWVERQRWHNAYRTGWIEKMKERCRAHWTELGASDGSLGISKRFRVHFQRSGLSSTADPRCVDYVDPRVKTRWHEIYAKSYDRSKVEREERSKALRRAARLAVKRQATN